MAPYTQYKGGLAADTLLTPSPAIWADAPITQIQCHETQGHYFFDDFLSFLEPATGITTPAEVQAGPYRFEQTLGVTVLSLANTDHGVIQVGGNDADNDGSVMSYGHQAGMARFGDNDSVWFECRIKKVNVTDEGVGFFIGLYEGTVTPTEDTTLVADTADPDASEDFIGFSNLLADGDVVEPIYQIGGTAQVNTGDIAIAADTYLKLGLRFKRGTLEFYLNGLKVNSTDTRALANTVFPKTNHLSPLFATKVGTAAAAVVSVDWWGFCATADDRVS